MFYWHAYVMHVMFFCHFIFMFSGTVSLLAGATPGMHYPESRFYLRRVRLSNNSDLLPALRDAGFHIEDAVDGPGKKMTTWSLCCC